MGQTPTTTNSGATLAKTTVQDAFSAATTLAETAIIAQVPFLAAPVLKQIWEALFSYIVGKISTAFGNGAAFIVIDIQTYGEVVNAASAFQALKTAQSQGDPNAIAQARAAADAAAASLIHYDGSG